MRKILIILLLSIACVAAATALLTNNHRAYGHMDICVYDAMTSLPVEGAYVVFPQSGHEYISDKNGRVRAYGIPVQKEPLLDSILPQSYGNATLIAYKEGYLPCCIFFVQLYEDTVRDGPNIYMFNKEHSGDLAVTPFIESPNESWINQLVEKFKPNMP